MKLRIRHDTKKRIKGFSLVTAVIITAFFIKIFAIGSTPSPENNAMQNFLTASNAPSPVPTIDPAYTELEAKFEQEKMVLRKQIDELNTKVSRGEYDRKEALKKEKVIKAINNNIGGVFTNKGNYIFNICKKYNVNPMMLTAIMKHETANGTSEVCKNANNPGGVNWYEGCGYSKYGWYQKYPNIEIGIEKMAKLIKENYIDQGRGDIASIGKKYAPPSDPRNGIAGMDNHAWPVSVSNIYIKILNEAEQNI